MLDCCGVIRFLLGCRRAGRDREAESSAGLLSALVVIALRVSDAAPNLLCALLVGSARGFNWPPISPARLGPGSKAGSTIDGGGTVSSLDLVIGSNPLFSLSIAWLGEEG